MTASYQYHIPIHIYKKALIFCIVIIISCLLFTTRVWSATYTWNVAAGPWTTAGSWNPTRTTPATDDILIFDGSVYSLCTASAVPTQIIGQLKVINNCTATFTASGAVTLTINTSGIPAFQVDSSCVIIYGGANGIITKLSTISIGTVFGDIVFAPTAAVTNALTSQTANGIIFTSGATLQNTPKAIVAGNPFGTLANGTINSIIFKSGSAYYHAGTKTTYSNGSAGDPFVAAQPASIVSFEPGSLFYVWNFRSLSFSGRTVGNITFDNQGPAQTIGGNATWVVTDTCKFKSTALGNLALQSISPVLIGGDLIVESGSAGFADTPNAGTNVNFQVSGNLIADGTFTPAPDNGRRLYTLNGVSIQSVKLNAGSAPLPKLTVNNAAGIILYSDVTVSSVLTMTSGNINTQSYKLRLGYNTATTGTLTYTSGKIIGTFEKWISTTVSAYLLPLGSTNYNAATVSFTTAPSASGVLSASFYTTNPGGTVSSLMDDISLDSVIPNGYWTISSTEGLTGGTYDLSLNANGFNNIGNINSLRVVKRVNGISSWTLDGSPGTNNGTIISRTGMSGFSDFAVAIGSAPFVPETTVLFEGFETGTGNGAPTGTIATFGFSNDGVYSGNAAISYSGNSCIFQGCNFPDPTSTWGNGFAKTYSTVSNWSNYTVITFWAKHSSGPGGDSPARALTIRMEIGSSTIPWQAQSYNTFALTTNWQRFAVRLDNSVSGFQNYTGTFNKSSVDKIQFDIYRNNDTVYRNVFIDQVELWTNSTIVSILDGTPTSSPISWLKRQMGPDLRVGQSNSPARLLFSFGDGPGADNLLINSNNSYIYDDAVGIIALTASGDTVSAKQILNGLDAVKTVSGPSTFWYTAYDATSVKLIATGAGARFTGNNAWVDIAANYYESKTGDTTFRNMVNGNLLWMQQFRASNIIADTYGGFSGGFSVTSTINNYMSTEHNCDAYSAYYYAGILQSNSTYTSIAADINNYLTNEMWGPSGTSNGIHTLSVMWEGYNDYLIPTDCQSLAVLGLGTTGPGGEPFYQGLNYAMSSSTTYATATVDALWNGYSNTIATINGFSDFTTLPTVTKRKAWAEGSEQMIAALRKSGFNTSADYFNTQITQMVSPFTGGVHYASNNTDGFSLQKSVAATGWYYFNNTGGVNVNPLRPDDYNTAPNTPSLITPLDNLTTNNHTVLFSWSTSTDAEFDPISYTLQVANDNGFVSVATTVSVSSTNVQISGLPNGTLYWHIKSSDTYLSSAYSGTRNILEYDTTDQRLVSAGTTVTFYLGDSTGFLPVTGIFNTTNADTVTITVFDQFAGGLTTLFYISRHWNIQRISAAALNVDLTFSYTASDFADSDVLTENDLYPAHYNGSTWDSITTGVTPDSVNHKLTVTGVTGFSKWTLGGPNGAVPVEISGFSADKE